MGMFSMGNIIPDRYITGIMRAIPDIRSATICELATDETKKIEIPVAKFYTSKGVLSEVSAEWWRVGNKMELTGIDMDLEGGTIELPD